MFRVSVYRNLLLERMKFFEAEEDQKKKDKEEREKAWREKVKKQKEAEKKPEEPKKKEPEKKEPAKAKEPEKKKAEPKSMPSMASVAKGKPDVLPKVPSLELPPHLRPSVKMPAMPTFDPSQALKQPPPPALGPEAPLAKPGISTPPLSKLARPRKAAMAPATVPTKEPKATPGPAKPPPIDIPAFYRTGLKSQQPLAKHKVGDVLSLGKFGQAKITNKIGNRFYLQKPDGRKYVYVPYRGIYKLD